MSDGLTEPNLRARTKAFALRIIKLYCGLPKTELARVLGRQMLHAGTSIGAHYREGTRARSNAEFVSKLEAGNQEAEEVCYWLELLEEARVAPASRIRPILAEASEIIAMQTASVKTVKRRVK